MKGWKREGEEERRQWRLTSKDAKLFPFEKWENVCCCFRFFDNPLTTFLPQAPFLSKIFYYFKPFLVGVCVIFGQNQEKIIQTGSIRSRLFLPLFQQKNEFHFVLQHHSSSPLHSSRRTHFWNIFIIYTFSLIDVIFLRHHHQRHYYQQLPLKPTRLLFLGFLILCVCVGVCVIMITFSFVHFQDFWHFDVFDIKTFLVLPRRSKLSSDLIFFFFLWA